MWISSSVGANNLLIQTPRRIPFFFTSSLDPKESKTPTHKITAPRRKAALHASVAASPRVKQDV